ncbi:hypothetical protein EJB05_44165, partial [Eragrostis curvula]
MTFWAARPPRVSCFTVHCPSSSAFTDLPRIINTEDDLVLLRVSVRSRRKATGSNEEYFVYQAGNNNKHKQPKLHRIPMPAHLDFSYVDPALLRCRVRDTFYVAMICRQAPYHEQHFAVHLFKFNPKASGNWTAMAIDSPKETVYYNTSKAITIGGSLGSVGWVDLWRGILICDVFLGNKQLRYIALPPPLAPKPLRGSPSVARDIIVAVTRTMDLSKSDSRWEDDCKINVSEVALNNLALNIPVEVEDSNLTLMRLHAVYPALSSHDDGVVYIINKIQHHDYEAWVIGADMRHRALKDVAYFGGIGRPVGYGFPYHQSGISKHLGKWSTTRHGRNAAETSSSGMVQPSNQLVEGTNCRVPREYGSYREALMGTRKASGV